MPVVTHAFKLSRKPVNRERCSLRASAHASKAAIPHSREMTGKCQKRKLTSDARVNRSPIPYAVSDEECTTIKNGGHTGARGLLIKSRCCPFSHSFAVLLINSIRPCKS